MPLWRSAMVEPRGAGPSVCTFSIRNWRRRRGWESCRANESGTAIKRSKGRPGASSVPRPGHPPHGGAPSWYRRKPTATDRAGYRDRLVRTLTWSRCVRSLHEPKSPEWLEAGNAAAEIAQNGVAERNVSRTSATRAAAPDPAPGEGSQRLARPRQLARRPHRGSAASWPSGSRRRLASRSLEAAA